MDLQKLNKLSQDYRLTGDQDVFAEIYVELADHRQINERKIIRSGYGDANDALSVFNDTLMRIIRKSDVRDFGKTFTSSLRNARIDFIRKEKRRLAKPTVPIVEQYDECEAATSEIVRTANDIVEFDVLTRAFQKKEADKQRLIDFLLESSQILFGPKMTAIIKGLPDYDSVNDAATSNGLSRNQIARPLQKLSRLYDPSVHGDILEYFPKGTRIKREFLTA